MSAMGEVTVKVEGCDLVAVSSGNHTSDELNVTDHRNLFNGSILAILRSGMSPGKVTVTATCPGLKSAKVDLKTW